MRLKRWIILVMILPLIVQVDANPIALVHRAYISAETLSVRMTLDAAEIEGVFQFHSAMPKDDFWGKADIEIEIPIWIPSAASERGPLAQQFIQAYREPAYHDFEKTDRSAWDAAIGFKFRIGKQDVPPVSFGVLKPAAVRSAWRREGYFCVIVTVMVPPRLLAAKFFGGAAETTISYRQPLRRAHFSSEFFYVPTFDDLPSGNSTADIKQYSMHLKNVSGSILNIGETKINAGYSAVLPLAHHRPVVFQVSAK